VSPRLILRRSAAAAAAAFAVSLLVGCGGGSSPPANVVVSAADQGQEYWGSDPLEAAIHLAEGQYSRTLDAWQFKLSHSDDSLPEFKWSVRKVNNAHWNLTGTIVGDNGVRKRGHWQILTPLDRNPTPAQMERVNRGHAVEPIDGGAIELSGCPPGGCEAAVGE
jgi:hypothetical protein